MLINFSKTVKEEENSPGVAVAGGEAEGDGQALLAVEDSVCCSRWRQHWWREGWHPDVVLMENGRTMVKLSGAICCCCTATLVLLQERRKGHKGSLCCSCWFVLAPGCWKEMKTSTGSATCWRKWQLVERSCWRLLLMVSKHQVAETSAAAISEERESWQQSGVGEPVFRRVQPKEGLPGQKDEADFSFLGVGGRDIDKERVLAGLGID
ncbi:hypothetical protein NC651_033429 [Populus alba x Populus x berolinensis]|nr:hypothetical protein NC651_033429 [Populus alba x Populus x berolinensis]